MRNFKSLIKKAEERLSFTNQVCAVFSVPAMKDKEAERLMRDKLIEDFEKEHGKSKMCVFRLSWAKDIKPEFRTTFSI